MRGIRRVFRLAVRRPDVDDELETELRFHFDQTIADLERAGWTRAEAEAEAHRRFGDYARHHHALRALQKGAAARKRRGEMVDVFRQNAMFAFRMMRRAPGFTIVIVVTLGLGIGANAVMFGVVDRLLLSPPAQVHEPDDLRRILIRRTSLGREVVTHVLAYPDYEDFLSGQSLAGVAVFAERVLTMGRGPEASRVRVTAVSGDFFGLLGTTPVIGRGIIPADDVVGSSGAAVLGYELWQRRFGGDPTVLGRAMPIGSLTYTIVGVAPPGFTGINLAPVDVWLPIRVSVEDVIVARCLTSRGCLWVRGVARLKPDTPPGQVTAELTLLHRQGHSEQANYPDDAAVELASLIAARGHQASDEAAVSRWLAGVSMVVLLIASANVANLLLARGTRRRRELAVRVALGAGRTRLVGQLLTESIVLALAGGAAALTIAHFGQGFVHQVLVPDVAWTDPDALRRIITFTAIVSVLTGVIAGMMPAFQTSQIDLATGLKQGAGSSRSRRSVTRVGLLVAQAALSLVLLVGAGLFVKSLDRIRSADLGLDIDRVLLTQFDLGGTVFDSVRTHSLYTRSLELLGNHPVVEAVAAAGSSIPFRSSFATLLRIQGIDSLPALSSGGPYLNAVTRDYLATVGLRMVRGRWFTEADREGSQPVAVVNETMARLVWPDGSPMGACLRINDDDAPCAEVVGIVADARRQQVIEDQQMQYYVPLEQYFTLNARLPLRVEANALLVRTVGDPDEVSSTIQRALQALDPGIAYVITQPLRELVDPQLRSWTLGATMFTIFGLLALVVAAVGLYSVLSFDVAQRTRELGVRAALGAGTDRIVTLVLRQGMQLVTVGVVVGLTLAFAVSRPVAPLLYEVSPTDLGVFAAVTTILLAVAAVACAVPAWRATRVDPMVALRVE